MVDTTGRADAGRYETSLVTSFEEFEALRPEWRDLLWQAAVADEMHHDPEVVRLALTGRDSVAPRFIVVRASGRIRAIAPFHVQRTRVPLRLSVVELGSVRARTLRLLGDRPILHRDENPDAVFDAVFERLGKMRRQFDLIWIYSQRLDEPLWTYLSGPRSRAAGWTSIVTSAPAEKLHRLVFKGSFEAYLPTARSKPGFPGKTIRRFWRDHRGRAVVHRIDRSDQVASFLDAVDCVYNRSWQARTYGVRRRNAAGDVARFEAIAALGYLRSYLLTIDEDPVAFVVGYQYGGRFAYDETGYDTDRSAGSPGSVLTYAVIEDLFRDRTPRELDFGFGDGGYKRTFGNATTDICTIYVSPSIRWRAVLGAQRALNAVDVAGRTAATRLGLAARVRRLLKRQGQG